MRVIKEHKRSVHVGIVEIPQSLILKLLQYPDGIIRSIRIPTEKADIVEIQLEHPEMPELESGYHIPIIDPEYTTYEDCLGHKVEVRTKSQK